MPLFSIVIPTRNRPDLLVEAIESVQQQTIDDWEIVVVNDGGVSPKLPDDERVRLLSQNNMGLPAARNSGIRAARGDIITFLDDDDLITPNRLELALRGIDDHPITACGKSFGTPTSIELERFLRGSALHPGQLAMLKGHCLPFDERFRMSEDVEWTIRLLPQGIRPIDEIGYVVRSHAGPRLTDDVRQAIEMRRLLIATHVDYFEAHPDIASYQLRMLGVMAAASGQPDVARTVLRESRKRQRSWQSAAWLLMLHLSRRLARRAARSRLVEHKVTDPISP